MGFDAARFMGEAFVNRTAGLPVKDLADWFDAGADPVWVVRGLTGTELARAKEAQVRNKGLATAVEALMGGGDKEKAEAIRKLFGAGDQVPDEIARRIEMLIIGSVDPVCDLELALKICKVFPVVFYDLTNRITELTGRGHVPGKAVPSGETTK